MEAKVLGAEERIWKLNYELFCRLRERAAAETAKLQQDARALAELDALLALSELAARKDYVRPEVNDGDAIEIKAGRHPVIEELFKQERFIPNDVYLDCADHQLLIITGPNMAGKSTVLRQTALIVLMAQMGSFVPADSARIGVCDRIFTRVGAADILSKGMSTFMVEMTETANILRYATRKSLILLDEIGRGTSTFDGLAIAWAVAEFLHDQPEKRAKTMFATHYHELVDLAETKPRVKNYNIAVKEWNGQVIFLRKLQPGGTSRSYGIEVARLAGLPPEAIRRAKEILANLEAQEHDPAGKPALAQSRDRSTRDEAAQLSFLQPPRDPALEEVLSEIRALNLNAMTPIEALTLLDRLRKKILK
jgi:DNA mismatch repair protein MutS